MYFGTACANFDIMPWDTPLSQRCTAVTRAEKGQQKRLLLLDRQGGWGVVDELLLDIGPRYFSVETTPTPPAPQGPAATAEEGAAAAAAVTAAAAPNPAAPEAHELQLPAGLRPGDRLLLKLPAAAIKQHQKKLKELEKQGGCAAPSAMHYCHFVHVALPTRKCPHAVPTSELPSPPGVEVEVVKLPEAAAKPRISDAEGMGPLQVGRRATGCLLPDHLHICPHASHAITSRLFPPPRMSQFNRRCGRSTAPGSACRRQPPRRAPACCSTCWAAPVGVGLAALLNRTTQT